MASIIQQHSIAWAPPSPLWSDASPVELRRPAILRFATDEFMQELQRLVAFDPDRLREFLAVPETWRGIRRPAWTPNPAGGRAGVLARLGVASRRTREARVRRPEASSDANMKLKLYQPAHQRFYLLACSLVCHTPGLPDRKIDLGKRERVSFLMRRWFPPNADSKTDPEFDSKTWIEHAFASQPDGSFAWVPVAGAGAAEAQRAIVLTEEERLPLFPCRYGEDDGRTRRLLAGLIPVGRREAYHAAPRLTASNATNPNGTTRNTARLALFRKQVSEPWKAVVEQARSTWKAIHDGDVVEPPESDEALREARSKLQLGSWLVLIDLAAYLKVYLPKVHAAIANESATVQDVNANAVLTALRGARISPTLANALRPAPGQNLPDPVPERLTSALLKLINDPRIQQKLEASRSPYGRPKDLKQLFSANPSYPEFLFPLADPVFCEGAARVPASSAPGGPAEDDGLLDEPKPPGSSVDEFGEHKAAIDHLTALVIRALEFEPGQPEPEVPSAVSPRADMRPGWFQLRCVYERPECGVLHRDVVSEATEEFQLAGYFDPDAPARPIRIGLPIDTTPAGLRKFDKNTAFLMSDVLCGQVARFKGLTFGDLVLSVLPWPFHKDLRAPDGGPCPDGLVCSLSIPIITICALILLIIMVALLDLIFRWIPFFSVCFPLPGLRAKKEEPGV